MPQGDAAAAAELRSRFGFLREIVSEMERQVPYAAALVRSRKGFRLNLRDGDQNAARLDPQDGVVLTASNGYGLEESSTDDLEPTKVRALAEELVERCRAERPPDGATAIELAIDSPGEADFVTPMEIDPGQESLADKLERNEALRLQLRRQDQRAVQAIVNYGEQSEQLVFVNRGGMVTQQLNRIILTMVLFVTDGQDQRYHFLQRAATGGLERVTVSEEDLATMAQTAVSLLSAGPVEPGSYDVVSDPVTTGTIAHEAFGHGVETDMFLKQRARAAEYVGRQVGSELVNILDDPTVPGGYGSYFVDDEGKVASPTQIIRDGIFQRGITDLYSATRLGIDRSANGRRESVQRKAYARMSNTFFAPGSSSREELLASLDHGYELCDAQNGMEDPKGWGMQIWAQYAREYRGGRPTGRLFAPVAITGYVPDVLAAVSMVSRDFELWAGTCGKGWKELVPVGSGGPFLRTRCRLG